MEALVEILRNLIINKRLRDAVASFLIGSFLMLFLTSDRITDVNIFGVSFANKDNLLKVKDLKIAELVEKIKINEIVINKKYEKIEADTENIKNFKEKIDRLEVKLNYFQVISRDLVSNK